jgi:DegV family protein with EDD domain
VELNVSAGGYSMPKVGIVTDSTNCLPPHLLKEFDIRVVPVGMVIDGKPYRDLVDITLSDFKVMVNNLEKQPTTTAANPGDFLSIFTDLTTSTDSIVCILVSKVLTATQESAYQARRLIRAEHPSLNIEIIDSKTSAGALGFIVLEAAKAAQQNKSLQEVMAVAQDMIFRVVYLAALDTLTYLMRIGRAPKVTSIGEMLNVKPIIGFVDDTGLIDVVARVRGQRKSLNTLVDLVEKYVDTDKPIHTMVHYSNGLEQVAELRSLLEARYNCVEMYQTEYSPVMLSASGPLIGLSVYSDE